MVAHKHDLVEVKSSVSILDTLRIMNDRNVSTVPIYNAPDSDSNFRFVSQGRVFLAVIDIADIIAFVLQTLQDMDEADKYEGDVERVLNMAVESIKGKSLDADLELDLSIEPSTTQLTEVMRRMSQGWYFKYVLQILN